VPSERPQPQEQRPQQVQSEEIDPLLMQLIAMLCNIVRTLIGYFPKAFANWPHGMTRLKELMKERGEPEPTLNLLFDVIEENPELGISMVEDSFNRLPFSVKLSVNAARGIAEGLLKLKPEWRKELEEGREELILTLLRNPKDPDFVVLAQTLENHPKTLKAITDWILAKLGI